MKNTKIAVIGLGYVGLPLFFELSKHFDVKGFDINSNKIRELRLKLDRNNIYSKNFFNKINLKKFTDDYKNLIDRNVFIVCVPTPIKKNFNPDLKYLTNSSKLLGKIIKNGDIVVYESTVYPGCTEDHCIPILEKFSRMKVLKNSEKKKGFYVCYSPERINPGDNVHNLNNVVKVLSGLERNSTLLVKNIYNKIVKIGIHIAKDIKTAEAAKIIENTQRDLNIALVNEFSIIFEKLNINIGEVLKAAKTKWNFLNFKPGLVGGHCIGVDPYYLTYISKKNKYLPKTILSGRIINDNFYKFIIKKIFKEMKRLKINQSNSKILIMGYTFKENISDFRNSKVKDLVNELIKKNVRISIFDPHVNLNLIKDKSIKNKFIKKRDLKKYDAIILTVPHKEFINYSQKFYKSIVKKNFMIFDLKNAFKLKMKTITL